MPPRGRKDTRPSGAAVLRRVQAEIAEGWKPGLTALTGEDLYHLDAAQRILLAHLVPEGASDFALSVFGEGQREGTVDVGELVAAARSMPMFAPRRVVLLRDVVVLEGDESPLAAYAASPPPDSFLLVRAPKLDLRRTLHKALTAGIHLEFLPTQTDSELRAEITTMARERGLTLAPEVASFLEEASAGDLHRVGSELDKIAAWLGPTADRRVALEHLREVGALGGGALSGWEVADAVLEKSAKQALEAVRKLIERGDEPIRILGGIAYRARTLLQAKAMSESGASRGQIASALRAWAYQDALHRALERYSLGELLGFPARLLEADRCLKSRSLDPRTVLEDLVTRLTGSGTSRVGEVA